MEDERVTPNSSLSICRAQPENCSQAGAFQSTSDKNCAKNAPGTWPEVSPPKHAIIVLNFHVYNLTNVWCADGGLNVLKEFH
jgi:hypothetical protein